MDHSFVVSHRLLSYFLGLDLFYLHPLLEYCLLVLQLTQHLVQILVHHFLCH
uniref:Uncharacterized protein n=1 Tax=uncultured marine virus TaxID=186617 RepID=A0A0F7L9V5_9VIRU|nr:hypothetical protein [uncultured marine virus]